MNTQQTFLFFFIFTRYLQSIHRTISKFDKSNKNMKSMTEEAT